MKVVKQIVQYIFALILAMSILALVLINIISSSILSENYILAKLDEEDYYNKIYESAKSNFENYINQSGLDEEVLNNIITKEKVEKDTKKIISNIFNGLEENVDTEEVKNTLTQNINSSLGRTPTATEQKAIDAFIEIICKEYKTTILSTQYEQKIYSLYKQALKYIDLAKKALLIVSGVSIVLIVLLTIKRIYRVLARIGVVFTIDGLLLLLAHNYINSNVGIEGISILNASVSRVLRNILKDILSMVMTNGIILLSVGVVLILVYAIIKSIRKDRRMKERYNPEK